MYNCCIAFGAQQRTSRCECTSPASHCRLTRRFTSKLVFLFVNLICLNLSSPGSGSLERRVSGFAPLALLLLIRFFGLLLLKLLSGMLPSVLELLLASTRAAFASISWLRSYAPSCDAPTCCLLWWLSAAAPISNPPVASAAAITSLADSF